MVQFRQITIGLVFAIEVKAVIGAGKGGYEYHSVYGKLNLRRVVFKKIAAKAYKLSILDYGVRLFSADSSLWL